MKCSGCAFENREGAKFCVECGAKLELKCPKCGNAHAANAKFCDECGQSLLDTSIEDSRAESKSFVSSDLSGSFYNDRFELGKLLGEGSRKKVYLAHDNVLDRDVAIAFIKTEGLDEASRARMIREYQATGKLGSHQNIVTVFDVDEQDSQPYIITELMESDVEDLLDKAADHRLSIEQIIEISTSVCKGLEFAHSKGIIHRDLKPGNVWLTADEVVKIGDFGLALVEEHTRLTLTDHMVGTVTYLPPEQASGGQASNSSDLYSLGVMMYEMVTGRPPFVGDNPESIIGQHINAIPVDPSFHRPDMPRVLEALILRLLEKDPQKRPASSSEVIQALESIQVGEASETLETDTTADISPIYRRVFVGRESELKQLKSAFDDACSGKGSLAMVVGEPGIGKTALCEELKTYVSLRGGQTLVGHCYEEGSLSLPYLAFVEAMRSYVLEHNADHLRKALGSGATHVGRIVSEVRDRLQISLPEPASPEEEQYRLMQSISDFLSHAASLQPMLIVLEDLHDSDQGTLDMLRFVSRQISKMRILIVGNYRDVEVNRSHPLSKALAELRRVTDYSRVLLRGLNADEVHRMLTNIIGQELPWGVSEDVFSQTEGNPLFVQEVIRHFVEEGQIRRKNGKWHGTKQSDVAMRIPEGLSDVIGKRLSTLSDSCNAMLTAASVIGREFRFDILLEVASVTEDDLIAALEEAMQAAVIEERSVFGETVIYRFTHAFFRQILYEELIAPKRIKIHQHVAQALEALHKNRLAEHAAELAEHFSYSSDPNELLKAVEYSELAAKRALSVYAFGEAVRLLEQALQVQEVKDPDDKAKQCSLLLMVCDALLLMGESRRAIDVEAAAAFSIAEALGDNKLAFQSCFLVLTSLSSYAPGYPGISPALRSEEAYGWAKKAALYAESNTIEDAISAAFLGRSMIAREDPQGKAMVRTAMELAREIGDYKALWVIALIVLESGSVRRKEALQLSEEMLKWPRLKANINTLVLCLFIAVGVFLRLGFRNRAEEIMQEVRELAEQTKQPLSIIYSMAFDAIIATLDGCLEDVESIAQNLIDYGKDLGNADKANLIADVVSFKPSMYLGRAESRLLALSNEEQSHLGGATGALCLAIIGRNAEAYSIIQKELKAIDKTNMPLIGFWPTMLLEVAVMAGNDDIAEDLLERFNQQHERISAISDILYITCTYRHLGAAAALIGRNDEALSHYEDALNATTDMQFRPEIALTRFQLAELQLKHYPSEWKEAIEHLDFALSEFKEMKMQPYIEKAQNLKAQHQESIK